MIKISEFTEEGLRRFRELLDTRPPPEAVSQLLGEEVLIRELDVGAIDANAQFESRFEFGFYLNAQLASVPTKELFSKSFDAMWAWIAAVYFAQLTKKEVRRFEHYIPAREGTAGSILHRHAARTAVELVRAHGPNARFALQKDMAVQGQLLESLTASQSIARNRGFFAVASLLYSDKAGKIRRGANAKPKKLRKPGETTGMGSIRRLPIALRRLDLTFDVDQLDSPQLIELLPREFGHWNKK